jgi:hypothetical protein
MGTDAAADALGDARRIDAMDRINAMAAAAGLEGIRCLMPAPFADGVGGGGREPRRLRLAGVN